MDALLPVFGLAGFFLGFALFFLLFWIVWRRGRLQALERALLILLGCLLIWFGGNFMALLLRQMAIERVAPVLGLTDALSFTALALLPALLLHTHWLYYLRNFEPAGWERKTIRPAIVGLYLPLIFLPIALGYLFPATALNPIQRMGVFSTPFLIVLGIAYYACCLIQVRILQRTERPVERALFSRLAVLFVLIPIFNAYVFIWGGAELADWGPWLVVLALLSSVIPGLIVSYYIYRYGFLQIVVEKGIATLLIIFLTLAVYLVAIRRLVVYLEAELDAPGLLLESIFLALLLFLFPTVSGWFEKYASHLFSGEIRKYRRLTEHLSRVSPQRLGPRLFQDFIERTLRRELNAGRVRIYRDKSPQPSTAAEVFPLEAGDRLFGWLEIEASGLTKPAGREAFQLLTKEIAFLLERSQFIETRMRMEKELAGKSQLEQLGRTAADVAHNVKNPLSSMKTLLQLLEEADNLRPEQREEIAMMIGEIDRLSGTITQLLKFSRLEATASGRSLSIVNLQHLVDSIKRLYQPTLQNRGIELSLELDLANPLIESDLDALTDILGNLLANAADACNRGDRITLELRRRKDQLLLRVADTGPGIPQSLRPRLYEPFVTQKARGTGLGLAIVRSRTQQLHGNIDLESTPDIQGTSFTVTIPLIRQAAPEVSGQAQPNGTQSRVGETS